MDPDVLLCCLHFDKVVDASLLVNACKNDHIEAICFPNELRCD